MDILTIEKSLKSTFLRHRLVFWYDETGEWRDAFEAISEEVAAKLEVNNNEFGTKVRILRAEPHLKYLLYIPSARPADADNWLLDLLLRGYEFKPDKNTLLLSEAGLRDEFREIVETHSKFFNNKTRIAALKALVTETDSSQTLRMKMMAVLCGLKDAQLDKLLMSLIRSMEPESAVDPAVHFFASSDLTAYFWEQVAHEFSYESSAPSVRDFVVSLFRGANPLDEDVQQTAHSRVFLQRWKDSIDYRQDFERWSHILQQQLLIEENLSRHDGPLDLGDADAFELFEKYTLHQLREQFADGLSSARLEQVLQKRRQSWWWPKHSDGYSAIEHAVVLREQLSACELRIDSAESGAKQYAERWWRIDMAYRRCIFHLSKYGEPQLMAEIKNWVERTYLTEFLLPLANEWSNQVRKMSAWQCEGLLPQREFFQRYVQPFLDKNQKVVVIVSDALRYEAANELAETLHAQKSWTAETGCMLASLPSYTQLGLASLLPTGDLSLDPETAVVFTGNERTDGIGNRKALLNRFCDGKAVAISAEEFMELQVMKEGRPLMSNNDVIYIYHNVIDEMGDDLKTESKTFEAVHRAFQELEAIAHKAASINANNLLITADHGFLFQQDPVNRLDDIPLPPAQEWQHKNRRFAIGKTITPEPGVQLFDAAALGLKTLGREGEWTAAFPSSLGRFPLRGSGKRFVHGGFSLQEVMVPVIKLHRERVDKTRPARVTLQSTPGMITAESLSLTLFQAEPVDGKVLPHTVRVGVFSPDGRALSEIKTLTFDSSESEDRLREKKVILALSSAADEFNNSLVEVRLDGMIRNTDQTINLATHHVKIQKLFTSDFNEF